jgi:hypothetical protein
MLIPNIVACYGGRGAIVQNYDYEHSFFKKGTLLITRQDGEPISGSIFQLEDGTCKGSQMGVTDKRLIKVRVSRSDPALKYWEGQDNPVHRSGGRSERNCSPRAG